MAQPFGMGNVDMNYYGPLQGGAGGPFGVQGGPVQGGMQFPQFFGGYDVKTQGGTRPGSFQKPGRPKTPAFRTMDFQDRNGNGIDDRDEGGNQTTGPNMYGAAPNQYTPVLQKGQEVTEVQADP